MERYQINEIMYGRRKQNIMDNYWNKFGPHIILRHSGKSGSMMGRALLYLWCTVHGVPVVLLLLPLSK